MTREEAIEELERLLRHWDDLENDKRCFWGYDKEAVALALSTLRPVSREQVEKVWRGEWKHKNSPFDYKIFVCKQCGKQISIQGENLDFCPACGAAQTDKAVEMVMERMEEMKNG